MKRHTLITTSRWTEWWNAIANKESVQINELNSSLARKMHFNHIFKERFWSLVNMLE